MRSSSFGSEGAHIGLTAGQRAEDADIDIALLKLGQQVVSKQKEETFTQAWRNHWRAAVWSMVLGTALIMEGLDTSMVRIALMRTKKRGEADRTPAQLVLRRYCFQRAIRRSHQRQQVGCPRQRPDRTRRHCDMWSVGRSCCHWPVSGALWFEADVHRRDDPHDGNHLRRRVRQGHLDAVRGGVSYGYSVGDVSDFNNGLRYG
jgi:hypothetical protein